MTDRGGAVTVDFVIMTAAVIGLGLLVVSPIADSVAEMIVIVSGKIREAAVFPGAGSPSLGN
ncbi:MAG: hypothetical protein AAF192_13140 [Pseudomonadota bacterium]